LKKKNSDEYLKAAFANRDYDVINHFANIGKMVLTQELRSQAGL